MTLVAATDGRSAARFVGPWAAPGPGRPGRFSGCAGARPPCPLRPLHRCQAPNAMDCRSAAQAYVLACDRAWPWSQSPERFGLDLGGEFKHALRADAVTARDLLRGTPALAAFRRQLMEELCDLVALKIQEGIVGTLAGHDFDFSLVMKKEEEEKNWC